MDKLSRRKFIGALLALPAAAAIGFGHSAATYPNFIGIDYGKEPSRQVTYLVTMKSEGPWDWAKAT